MRYSFALWCALSLPRLASGDPISCARVAGTPVRVELYEGTNGLANVGFCTVTLNLNELPPLQTVNIIEPGGTTLSDYFDIVTVDGQSVLFAVTSDQESGLPIRNASQMIFETGSEGDAVQIATTTLNGVQYVIYSEGNPEPATFVMFGSGVLALVLVRRSFFRERQPLATKYRPPRRIF